MANGMPHSVKRCPSCLLSLYGNERLLVILAAVLLTFAVVPGCSESLPAEADGAEEEIPPGDEMEEFNLTEPFTALLSGSETVPMPVVTNASGTAEFELSADGKRLTFELTVADIESVFAAHIHLGGRGENGEIAVFLFEGDPVSLTGVLAQGTITDGDVVSSAVTSLSELLPVMRCSEAYVNVHTNANPGGEIRGQVMPADGS